MADESGDDFLACARFAHEENRRVGERHLSRNLEHGLPFCRRPDHPPGFGIELIGQRPDPRFEPVRARPGVGRLTRHLGQLLVRDRERDVVGDAAGDWHLPLVECDAVLIERVLVNLLENAAKYTPPTATIRVTARVDAREMRVAVEDDGPGIRPGQEAEIFEKFTRGVRESSISGVGLGRDLVALFPVKRERQKVEATRQRQSERPWGTPREYRARLSKPARARRRLRGSAVASLDGQRLLQAP
jgi:anti-sigma regulatory factor (Ser/Thr protein kinase)